jgi:hypothetical protein
VCFPLRLEQCGDAEHLVLAKAVLVLSLLCKRSWCI